MKLNIAGLKVDSLTKSELFTIIQSCIIVNKQIWITTVYSEFLVAALKNPNVLEMLNQADIAVPDGIGIFWTEKFLTMPFTTKNYWLKILQAYWQALLSLIDIAIGAVISRPLNLDGRPAEKIPGSELVWDIAKIAVKNNFSMYLLGGFGDTPELAAKKLSNTNVDDRKNLLPRKLIVGYSNKNPQDESVIADINNARPDILLVAYGPIKQEYWILKNRDKLPSVKLFMGVGGTFDYLAGKRLPPPALLRDAGLEWLWRLFTQPHRVKRIWNATCGLVSMLIHYKVFTSLPLRKNTAVAILNRNGQILICKRNPANHHADIIHSKNSLSNHNYWQLPQGGVDEAEDLLQAAKREALEETGLANLNLLIISTRTHTYIWNNALRKFWKNRQRPYKGQTQNIVYFQYTGNNEDVKIDNHEFIDYRWISINDLEKTLHPERLPLVKILTQDLKEMQEKGIINL